MAPKKHVPDAYARLVSAARGWPFLVNGQGVVTVGTVAAGKFKRWTFRLATYPEDTHDPAACVLAEIDDRRTILRVSKLGYVTPLHGPNWQGAHCIACILRAGQSC